MSFSSAPKKLRIGVMGCANIAIRSVIPAICSGDEFELVAVASRDKTKAESVAKTFACQPLDGYEALLDADVDAIYMPLPTGMHEEWVLKSLEVGKHLLVEKSFGLTLAATRAMCDAAEKHKLVVMENFMYRQHRQQKIVADLLSSEAIGAVRLFKASFGFPPLDPANFRYDAALGGGALLDAGAYTINAASHFLGSSLEVLSATLRIDEERGVDVGGTAALVADGRIPVQLAWGFDNFYQCGVDVWGQKGRLTTNRTFTAGPGFRPTVRVETLEQTTETLLPADQHFANRLSLFASRIGTGAVGESTREVLEQSRLLDRVRSVALHCGDVRG